MVLSAQALRQRQLRVLRLEAALVLHDALIKDVLDSRLRRRAALFTLGREVMSELSCLLALEPGEGRLAPIFTYLDRPFRRRAEKVRRGKRRVAGKAGR